jgi:SpoVK/Ycf46/Vps4 family AAA+-type ATPase
MTASAHVLQLVRAHYVGNESQFASAALSLARGSKLPSVRASIMNAVKAGHASGSASQPRPAQQMRPLPQTPASRMLQCLPAVTFADLMLETQLQGQLDEIVIELEYRDDLAARKLRARNRLLFHGPPGNGKSSSAAAVGEALGVSAYAVSLPQLIDIYVGGTGKNLGELFDAIRPETVVVFDEIDAVGSRRTDTDSSASKEKNSIINTFLTLLDRCKHGVIIGTTNRPDMIDPALMRRFDEKIEFPAPTREQMAALGQKLCEGYGVGEIHVTDCANFDEVAKRCETQARRIVMREILAAEEAAETEEDDGEEKAAE